MLGALFFSAPAPAFAPEEGELKAELRAAYGGLKSWKATVDFSDESGLSLQIWQSGGKWRQVWKTRDNTGTAASVGASDTVLASCTEKTPLPILLLWQPAHPVETWKTLGVDNATAGFAFCGEEPCLVLGAEPEDETTSQVRLNNENHSLLLLRFRNHGEAVQFSFEEYFSFKGFQFPSTGSVTFADGSPVRFSIKWDAINRADDVALYDAQGFSREFPFAGCGTMPALFHQLSQAFNSINPPRIQDF